jgi:outer membrane protein OmpA-like peptidoglycan-associated protein
MLMRSKAGIFSVVAVSVALLGCESVQDFSSNPEKQKTRQGTAIGAVGGAAVGLIVGGGWKGALIGAGVGALAGGMVGNYQDKQEAKLRQQMAGTGVEVVRMGDNLTLNMPGNVTFAFDSAKLNPQFDPVLDKLAQTLGEYNKTVIQVAGHTDSIGTKAYNMKLSTERADSVKSYLVGRGVPASRLVTIGAGPDYPIASNDTDAGRAENRRVEITIVPVTQDSIDQAKQG